MEVLLSNPPTIAGLVLNLDPTQPGGGCSGTCPDEFSASPRMEITQFLWALALLVCSCAENVFPNTCFEMSLAAIYVCGPLFFHYMLLRRLWLSLLYTLQSGIKKVAVESNGSTRGAGLCIYTAEVHEVSASSFLQAVKVL